MCYKVIVIAVLVSAMAIWVFLSKKETGIKGISNSDYNTLEYTDLDLNISEIHEKVLI